MLRLSKLTDYGVVVLVQLASDTQVQTAPCIARATGIPEPTVAKVLKILAANAIVLSQRGAHGGYRLSRPLHATSIADVIMAIDGPITMTACVETGSGSCEAKGLCPVHGRWDRVNEVIQQALTSITLADMVQPAWAQPADRARSVHAAPAISA
jgi:FeS assembly SUF system regulator